METNEAHLHRRSQDVVKGGQGKFSTSQADPGDAKKPQGQVIVQERIGAVSRLTVDDNAETEH